MIATAKLIVGRKIVKFETNARRVTDGHGYRTMHNPRITLDNGAVLVFSTEEHPDAAEYGTWVGYFNPTQRPRR